MRMKHELSEPVIIEGSNKYTIHMSYNNSIIASFVGTLDEVTIEAGKTADELDKKLELNNE